MMQLVKGLDLTRYTPRCYVIADNDRLSEEKAREYEQEMKKGTFFISKIPRARRVGQPIKTVPWTMLYSLFKSSQVFLGTLIPDLLLGIKRIDIIYVESFARVHSLSVTGKLLYPFADQFLVQWPELVSRYPKAIYQGVLV
ncbi:oligosaccharide biosynthesis protein Alg14 like protein [Rhizopus microsporus var. microsporus]|uniref:UDP-N-acetylglucosamine transferase subunit ALG14 n=1 Tax=Rhizopus microsporus var. microsporus TaxID=86635 RepID=A0A1X0QZ50_RHIZD|nr:oligosaccharide biosynthesis protein Alg14 like protein [Rhizopus microsporus var. microsporus]